MKLVDLPPGSDTSSADGTGIAPHLDAYRNEYVEPEPLTLVLPAEADAEASGDDWPAAPLPWETDAAPRRTYFDRHLDVTPDLHARRLALGALYTRRPRLLISSGVVRFVLPRSVPRAERPAVAAALGLLGAEAVVLAEAQAFLDRVDGGSVWEFFDLWAWDVDGEASHVETAFRVAWLYCVAMQGRGALPPVAYLRALGLVMPRGVRELADLDAHPAAFRSASDVTRTCQTGWEGYGLNLATNLRGAWEAYGATDAAVLFSRTTETPDEHDRAL